MAGKKGRCKRCGQFMSIPPAEHLASMVATPALAAAGVGTGAAAGAGGSSIGSWLKAGVSQVALAPITLDRVKRESKPSPLDDAEDSKPYVLAKPVLESRGRVKVRDNVVVRAWRGQLGKVQKLLRKINQAGYLISIPFIMIFLLGTAVRNRPMALAGATVVVLLNVGRLVAGGANLAIVPFRDGLNLKMMKKPLGRVIDPVVTIGVVILSFTFIPWLSGGASVKGSIVERMRSGAETFKTDTEQEVAKYVEKAKRIDVEKLGAQAQDKLKGLTDKAKPPSGSREQP